MLKQCLEIKARGCCMHVFLVNYGTLKLFRCFVLAQNEAVGCGITQ